MQAFKAYYYKKIKTKAGTARSKCGPCFSGWPFSENLKSYHGMKQEVISIIFDLEIVVHRFSYLLKFDKIVFAF